MWRGFPTDAASEGPIDQGEGVPVGVGGGEGMATKGRTPHTSKDQKQHSIRTLAPSLNSVDKFKAYPSQFP